MADVDMAQDEMFSGPVSESVPTSNTGFASRRSRADSTASFTYYDEEQENLDTWLEEEATIEEPLEEIGEQEQNGYAQSGDDLEAGERPMFERRRSSRSRRSRMSRDSRDSRTAVEDPLLKRHNSAGSAASNYSSRAVQDRLSQKIYIQSEDLTIVVAGFQTSRIGYPIYLGFCLCTAGLAYLLLRWLPRWRLRLVGSATTLRECKWVVIEVGSVRFKLVNVLTHLESMERDNSTKRLLSRLRSFDVFSFRAPRKANVYRLR